MQRLISSQRSNHVESNCDHLTSKHLSLTVEQLELLEQEKLKVVLCCNCVLLLINLPRRVSREHFNRIRKQTASPQEAGAAEEKAEPDQAADSTLSRSSSRPLATSPHSNSLDPVNDGDSGAFQDQKPTSLKRPTTAPASREAREECSARSAENSESRRSSNPRSPASLPLHPVLLPCRKVPLLFA